MKRTITIKIKILLLSIFAVLFYLNSFSNKYLVTNTNDAGAGSLRQAILNANADGEQIQLISVLQHRQQLL